MLTFTPTQSISLRDSNNKKCICNFNYMGLFKRGKVVSDHTNVGILGGTICWDDINSNDELVLKYPSNKIKKGAKLQVHDSQEVLLFIDGIPHKNTSS